MPKFSAIVPFVPKDFLAQYRQNKSRINRRISASHFLVISSFYEGPTQDDNLIVLFKNLSRKFNKTE